MIFFTSSWDDGSEYDMKLAEVLMKFNQKGTFYIPLANSMNREVLNSKKIREISRDFEIGAHTLNHKFLTSISNEEAEYEIKQSKVELEAIIGRSVFGFCFPGGKYRSSHIQYAIQAGFTYARTVNMFKLDYYPRIMNTTLQVYNHSKITYFIHLIKRGYFAELFQYSIPVLGNKLWDKLMFDILDYQISNDSTQKITIIHLWGHSWEIQENEMWRQLEHFFAHLNTYRIPTKTNFEISQL